MKFDKMWKSSRHEVGECNILLVFSLLIGMFVSDVLIGNCMIRRDTTRTVVSHLHYSRQSRDLCTDSKNSVRCNGG